MRRVMISLLFIVVLPAMADTECPVGYGLLDYTQLEYIESTGGQWIDTGYYSNNNTEWILKSRKVPAVGYINGSSGSVACNYFVARVPQWAWYSYKVYSYQFDESLVNEVSIKSKQLYINGRLIDTQTKSSPGEWTSPYSFTLFGLRKDASTIERYAGDIHRFTIIENDIIIRDFIPVKRESDGEIGMYDLVKGEFYGNDGTGKFIAGPHIGGSVGVEDGICFPCPPNTYKDFVGNSECTPCPDAMVSPSRSTSVADCGRVLWVGNKIFFMSSAPRTAHTLNVMDSEGNIFYGNLYSEQPKK